jgi:D-tyrosyl-tRNA(Tyr) deacylase
MRTILQRVRFAKVTVDDRVVGEIGPGLLLLLGVGKGDDTRTAEALAAKVANLRIFTDAQGKMNRSLLDTAGGCLVVSQFTLYADCTQGRRPFFGNAEAPEPAAALCTHFTEAMRALGVPRVETGEFGADMQVDLCNDGPVTIWLDTAAS